MLILLYVMDSLRPDMLGCYGFDKPTSPNIDRFARDAVLYELAYANTSWSFPSAVALLTSQYPRTVGTMHELDAIPQNILLLPEVMSQHGFHTVAISANGWFSPGVGIRGFARFELLIDKKDVPNLERRTKHITDRREIHDRLGFGDFSVIALSEDLHETAKQEITAYRESDVFSMIWSNDTHMPYFVRGKESYFGNSTSEFIDVNKVKMADVGQKALSLYWDMIRYNDEQFGRLLTFLREEGLYEDALIVLISDHGEAFGEHGVWEHSDEVYEERIRVPFIVKYPNNDFAGLRRSEPVQLLDVYPTIVAGSVGEAAIPVDAEGRNVHPNVGLDPKVVIFSETQQRPGGLYSGAVVRGRYKYLRIKPMTWDMRRPVASAKRYMKQVLSGNLGSWEGTLDLNEGPNMIVRGKVHAQMEGLYKGMLEHCQRKSEYLAKGDAFSKQQAEVSDEVLERLKALGYLE